MSNAQHGDGYFVVTAKDGSHLWIGLKELGQGLGHSVAMQRAVNEIGDQAVLGHGLSVPVAALLDTGECIWLAADDGNVAMPAGDEIVHAS